MIEIEKKVDMSPLSKQFLALSIEKAIQNVLSECGKLLPENLKAVYLFDEKENTCGLLESLERIVIHVACHEQSYMQYDETKN